MRRPRPRSRRLITIVALVLVIEIVGLYASSALMVSQMFSHRVERMEISLADLGLSAETISLTSADGVPLKAWWIPTEAPPRGVVVLLHGMDGMDASTLLNQALMLHEEGYAAIAFDMRAHGRSDGDRIGLAFEEPQDVAAALDWIERQEPLEYVPVALLGVSMGGATAIRTAAQRADADAVVSVSAFASIGRMMGHGMRLMRALDWMATGYAPFLRFGILTIYGAWPATASPLHDVPDVAPRPLLIIHGTDDQQIPVEHAEMLMDAVRDGAELWIVEGAPHFVYSDDGPIPDDAVYRWRIVSFLDQGLGSAE